MRKDPIRIQFYFLLVVMLGFAEPIAAQNYLSQVVSVDVKGEKLGDVLGKLGKAGGFYFSYSSKVVPKDSLVSIYASRRTLEEVLNTL